MDFFYAGAGVVTVETRAETNEDKRRQLKLVERGTSADQPTYTRTPLLANLIDTSLNQRRCAVWVLDLTAAGSPSFSK